MYTLLSSNYELFHRKEVFAEARLIFHNPRKKTSLKVNALSILLHISGKCNIKIKYENLLV